MVIIGYWPLFTSSWVVKLNIYQNSLVRKHTCMSGGQVVRALDDRAKPEFGFDSHLIFWFMYDLDRSTMHPKFNLIRVRTHNPYMI